MLIAVNSYSQNSEYVAGQSYFGKLNHVEYVAGNLPLVIAVPHDGNLKPDFIPDRKSGSTYRDNGTLEIAYEMNREIIRRTGKHPHLIILHLARKKLDANRDELEAAQDDPVALNSWNEYHGFIETAFAQVEKDFDRGFFIDLHGQRHPEERIEIGYCLNYQLLLLSDDELNDEAIIDLSSIKNLLKFTDVKHSELLRGDKSLGAIFEKYGVKSTPSPNDLNLQERNYFSGGYTTLRHAVMYDGNISGVQLELNPDLRSQKAAKSTGKMLVDVIFDYLETHWGRNLFIYNDNIK